MQDIYRQATRVLTWLGLAYENSDLVFQLCERLLSDKRCPLILKAANSIASDWIIFAYRNRRELIRKKLAEFSSRITGQHSETDRVKSKDSKTPSEEAGIPSSGPGESNATTSNSSTQNDELNTITDDERQALYQLLKRPYWNRHWVIQEFCLPSKTLLICGDRAMDSDHFLLSIFLAILLSSDGPEGSARRVLKSSNAVSLMDARIKFKQKPEEFDILETMCKFRSSLATEPRDKIYGMLGLLSTDDRDRLDIEYDKNSDASHCYIRAAKSFLVTRRNLDSLTVDRILSNSKIPKKLPTWVTDWSAFDRNMSRLPLGSRESSFTAGVSSSIFHSFSASHTCNDYTARFSEDSKDALKCNLILSGFDTDTLSEVTEAHRDEFGGMVMPSWQSLTGIIRFLSQWITLLIKFGRYLDTMAGWEKLALSEAEYPTGEDPLKVLCETIAVSDMRSGANETITVSNMRDGANETFAEFLRWRKRFQGPKKLSYAKAFGLHRLGSVYALAAALAGIRAALRNIDSTFVYKIGAISSRRLARTSRGYLALVPELSRAGDRIALFKGGKMPFVVREQGKQWGLIGCSYVHGIMFGKDWDES